MSRSVIGEFEARELFTPYYKDFFKIYQNSLGLMNHVKSCVRENSPFYNEVYSLTQSTEMWNYTVNWAIQILSQYPEVKHELHSHNSHWFNFHDLIYLRFKKLGDDLRPSNLKTKRISGIGCQAEIPGFPNKPTFVEAGYILDKTSSEFQDIYIICWSNDQKVWEINLVKEAGLQLDIFDNEITAKENLKSILKVKEEYKNQNRLDGSFN